MIREISLTQGKVALVDEKDFEFLSQFRWHAEQGGNTWYATRSVHRNKRHTTVVMHRFVLDVEDGMEIDHIDGDGLNNTRSNLRVCTTQQNQFNQRPQQGKSSSFKGVSWHKHRKKWRAQIEMNGKNKHLGLFTNETDAARAYDEAARIWFGEFAYLNFPEV